VAVDVFLADYALNVIQIFFGHLLINKQAIHNPLITLHFITIERWRKPFCLSHGTGRLGMFADPPFTIINTICQPQQEPIRTATKVGSATPPVCRPSPSKPGTYHSYNPSIAVCWKGCDYATGRVNNPKLRQEAEDMCKRYTSETMWTERGELDAIKDLRVHSEMFPTEPANLYRACLAGIRRQKY
jgi:hypothetical protein